VSSVLSVALMRTLERAKCRRTSRIINVDFRKTKPGLLLFSNCCGRICELSRIKKRCSWTVGVTWKKIILQRLNPMVLSIKQLSGSEQGEVRKERHMRSKKDIKREYKERKKVAGIFQVKNIENGKVLLGSSLNLDGPLNRHKFLLTTGSHSNKVLQKEWKEYGQDKFVFEVLEVVDVKDVSGFNPDDELKLLEQIWIEKLQPFGEKGYNTDSNIRQV
jgi:hypothetical protein